MRRALEISSLFTILLVLAGSAGLGSRARAQHKPGKSLSWPSSPADPVVRLDGVVKKLTNFEVAVQGTADGTRRRVETLKRPAGIDFDNRGRLLVTDSRQGILLRLDLDLGVALVFGTASTPALKRPLGVAAGPAGTIFVADGDLGEVVVFSSDGEVAATYGSGSLAEPVDVALSTDGLRLYVADAKADRVVIFDVESGEQVESFGGRGKGVAEFYGPVALEIDALGNLLVADRLNSRVQLFDSSGAFTRAIYGATRSSFSRPRDVTVDDAGRVFVTDEAQSQVQVFGADLEPLFNFGRTGLGDGEFLGLAGIAAWQDRLAVVDHAGGRVQSFRLFGITPAARQPETRPEPRPEPVVATTESTEPAAVAPIAEAREMPEPQPPVEREPPDPSPPAPASAPAAEASAVEPEEDLEGLLSDLVDDWAEAWAAQDVERYLTFYSESFLPANAMARDQWAAEREHRLGAPSSIEIVIEATDVDLLSSDRAEVTFVQSYSSDRFSDRVRKTLVMARESGGWKIVAETVLEAL